MRQSATLFSPQPVAVVLSLVLLSACKPSINDKEGVLLDTLATKEYSDAYLLGKALPTLSSFASGQSIRWSGSAWEVYTPGSASSSGGTGAVTSTSLADDSVTSAKILDGTIAAADIAAGAVTTTKITDAAVTPAKMEAGAPGAAGLHLISTSASAAAWSSFAEVSNTAYSHANAGDGTAQWTSTSLAPTQAQVKALAEALMPAGTVLTWAGASAPTGFLLCDGSAVSRTTYSRLFTAIGITHGQGDAATTFNIPDYRGRFLRGVDGGIARDPDRASRTTMNAGGNAGDNVGSVQLDALQGHYHSVNNPGGGGFAYLMNGAGYGAGGTWSLSQVLDVSVGGMTSDGSNGAPRTTSETRPVNAYVNYVIKY